MRSSRCCTIQSSTSLVAPIALLAVLALVVPPSTMLLLLRPVGASKSGKQQQPHGHDIPPSYGHWGPWNAPPPPHYSWHGGGNSWAVPPSDYNWHSPPLPSSSSSKSGKGSKSSSSSSSSDNDGGHWVWVEYSHHDDDDGWSSSSSWWSGGGSSGKSGKGESISYGGHHHHQAEETDDGWNDDGHNDNDDDGHHDDDGSHHATSTAADHHHHDSSTSNNNNHGPATYEAGWNADGWDNDGHYKADIDYVRAEVTQLILDSYRTLIPEMLRLIFHDCIGGCDGCIDLTNPDNNGLESPMKSILPLVEKFKDSYSRADIWTMAALVSADLAVVEEDRPEGLSFPMTFLGRKDCEDADAKGAGGADVQMPPNTLTTHGLLAFFEENFGFTADETVVVMGVHSVASASRDNSGFGNRGRDDGWVFQATDRIMNNRYYKMLVGDDDSDPVNSAPRWDIELVVNNGTIPDRYQWYHEEKGVMERPIMTNADMALVRDLKDYMHPDKNGVKGEVDCAFQEAGSGSVSVSGQSSSSRSSSTTTHSRRRQASAVKQSNRVVCPVASETFDLMIQYKNDNAGWLLEFEKVLDKMVRNGYPTN